MYPYRDLEQLLFRCFLTKPYKILGIPLLLKSLTEHGFEYITETYHYLNTEEEKLIYYIAYSILQIEGKNILPQREEILDEVIEVVSDWPYDFHLGIASELSVFRERVQKAHMLLEVYTYTDHSRMRWFCYKNKLLNDPQVTGWNGTQYIAMSSAQLSWITLNKVEDDRLNYEMINDASRFVATVYNYKGMKSLNDEEINRRKEETRRRKELVEEINRAHKDIKVDSDTYKNLILTPEERKNMDAKDLVEELSRMQQGIKDEHDFKVEEYEKAMKSLYLEDKKRRESLVINKMENSPEPFSSGIYTKSRVLDEDDLDKSREEFQKDFLRRRQQMEQQTSLQIETPIVERFAVMGKLDKEEDEEFLYRDIYKEASEEIIKRSSFNNDSIKSKRIITSPTMEDLKNSVE